MTINENNFEFILLESNTCGQIYWSNSTLAVAVLSYLQTPNIVFNDYKFINVLMSCVSEKNIIIIAAKL